MPYLQVFIGMLVEEEGTSGKVPPIWRLPNFSLFFKAFFFLGGGRGEKGHTFLYSTYTYVCFCFLCRMISSLFFLRWEICVVQDSNADS